MPETPAAPARPVTVEAIAAAAQPQYRKCPLLKEKNGDGQIELFDDKVVCRYYSQGSYIGARSEYSRCSAFQEDKKSFAPYCPYSGLQSQRDAANGLDVMHAVFRLFRKKRKSKTP